MNHVLESGWIETSSITKFILEIGDARRLGLIDDSPRFEKLSRSC